MVELVDVQFVSLYEFFNKFYFRGNRVVKCSTLPCIMVTPVFGARCVNAFDSAHEMYARSCVVAHWRMMPTSVRHMKLWQAIQELLIMDDVDVNPVCWGSTVIGHSESDFLGVDSLVRAFDGRKDKQGRCVGWSLAMMEMLVDPMLRLWVPVWIREQYERRNPFFRRALEDVMGTSEAEGVDQQRRATEFRAFCERRRGVVASAPVTSNKILLRRARDYMRWLEKREARRVAAEQDIVGDKDALEEDVGSGRASQQGSDVDVDSGAEEPMVDEMLREQLPDFEGDGGVMDGEAGLWEQATAVERLSAAGPAVAAADVAVGVHAVPGVAGGEAVNLEVRWVSEVDPREKGRLQGLWDLWRGKGVDAEEHVPYSGLDELQRFAYDIVEYKVQQRLNSYSLVNHNPLRLFVTGGAGTGKSRTIRSFVGRTQALVQERRGGRAGGKACILAAPTGCASFQMKFGACTIHRAFGVPVGYCGPLVDGGAALLRLQESLKAAVLAVLDELSMVGRQMLGKVFKCVALQHVVICS